jgi:hypothetical protein
MKNLIEILKNETSTLKIQFVEFTKEYATKEFNEMSKLTYSSIIEQYGYYDAKWNHKCQSKTGLRIWNKVNKMQYEGIESYVSKLIKDAEMHYEDSIIKLATRIEKKGLNIDSLKCTTSHIGRNIETTLTDGNKVVRAFTIIAEGMVQKPHYRYLVK